VNSELRSRLARLLPAVPGPSPIPHIQISSSNRVLQIVLSVSRNSRSHSLTICSLASFLHLLHFLKHLKAETLRARLESLTSSSPISTLSSRARAGKSGSTRARARARAWPNNKRAEPEQPRLGLGSARLHP
jgi:hypothetical protein